MLAINCPNCKTRIRGDEKYAGRIVACPSCKKKVAFPPMAELYSEEGPLASSAASPQQKASSSDNRVATPSRAQPQQTFSMAQVEQAPAIPEQPRPVALPQEKPPLSQKRASAPPPTLPRDDSPPAQPRQPSAPAPSVKAPATSTSQPSRPAESDQREASSPAKNLAKSITGIRHSGFRETCFTTHSLPDEASLVGMAVGVVAAASIVVGVLA